MVLAAVSEFMNSFDSNRLTELGPSSLAYAVSVFEWSDCLRSLNGNHCFIVLDNTSIGNGSFAVLECIYDGCIERGYDPLHFHRCGHDHNHDINSPSMSIDQFRPLPCVFILLPGRRRSGARPQFRLPQLRLHDRYRPRFL